MGKGPTGMLARGARRHGRTRAFAQSLVRPHEVDVDWYERIDTTPLEHDRAGAAPILDSSSYEDSLLLLLLLLLLGLLLLRIRRRRRRLFLLLLLLLLL